MRIGLFILVILSAGFLLTACSSTGRKTVTETQIGKPVANEEYSPTNLDDALVQVDRILGEEGRSEVMKKTEPEMIQYHFNLGLWIRNNWMRHPKPSPLKNYFHQLGINDPDDMSGIILTSYWRKLHGKPIDLDSQVAAAEAQL